MCTQGAQFLSFWEKGRRCWIFWILVVPDVFPSNSHCVPMKFSNSFQTCFKNSQCVPQHVSNITSLYLIHFALYSILETYASRPKGGDRDISILGLCKEPFWSLHFQWSFPITENDHWEHSEPKRLQLRIIFKKKTTLLPQRENYGR